MYIDEMTRKEFLALPDYEDDLELLTVKEFFILQTKKKHDSGYACFTAVAEINGQYYIIGQCHDVLEVKGCNIDCFVKNGVLRFFPNLMRNKSIIKITSRLSTFEAFATVAED